MVKKGYYGNECFGLSSLSRLYTISNTLIIPYTIPNTLMRSQTLSSETSTVILPSHKAFLICTFKERHLAVCSFFCTLTLS